MSAGQNPNSLPADFDVGAWLQRINLGQYSAAFAENEINAVALPLLTEEDLKSCGVVVLGHRKIILHEIQRLVAATKGESRPVAESRAAGDTLPVPPQAVPSPPGQTKTQSLPPVEAPTLRAADHPHADEVVKTEIIIRENGVEIDRRLLDPGEYVIGRDPECEFVLTDTLVSRRHAKLTIDRGHWLIEDIGSRSGTAINGFPVQEPTHVPVFPND